MAYLDDHPPRRSQFRCPRRASLSGVIVVHTAENTPDFVAFDGGAEAVAKFIVGRTDPGSYHDLVDSDSAINLVRYDCEAFQDGTGSNPHAIGISVATRADVWPLAPQAWRDGAITQLAHAAARAAAHVKARTGIAIPARRITRAQSEARLPGFISHAERDPGRRSDPGAAFPWGQFLVEYAALTAGGTPAPSPIPLPTPEDLMPFPTIGVQADPNNPQQAHLHRPWAVLKPGQVVWLTDWPLADIPPVHSEQALTSRQAQCDGATWRGLVAAGVVDTIEIITKDAEGRSVDVVGSTQVFDQAVTATRSTYASALPLLGP